MKKHLNQLYKSLWAIDKRASVSVARLTSLAEGAEDAPDLWERYPEDIEGTWESPKSNKEYFGEGETGIEMSEDLESLASPAVIFAIKKLLRKFNQKFEAIVGFDERYGYKSWKIFASDPTSIPGEDLVEWDMWEVDDVEDYGYSEGIPIPGTDRRLTGAQ